MAQLNYKTPIIRRQSSSVFKLIYGNSTVTGFGTAVRGLVGIEPAATADCKGAGLTVTLGAAGAATTCASTGGAY